MFYVSWVGRMCVRVFCILAAPHGIGAYMYGQPLVAETKLQQQLEPMGEM